MKILITGGLGFIGRNLIEYLSVKKNIKKIIIVDNLKDPFCKHLESLKDYKYFKNSSSYKSSKHRIEHVRGDVKNYKFALQISKNVDCIIHLAAEPGIDTSIKKPKHSFEINVIGAFNYLEAARINRIKSFIFASSGAVFGNIKPPMLEDYPRRPISPYGSGKLTIETFCETYSKIFGINSTILRFSNAYGNFSNHKQSVISKFIRNIINNKTITINGNGEQTRDYIHADDLTDAIFKSIIHAKGLNIYHVGTGKETSINTLIKNLKIIFKKNGYEKINIVNGEYRKGDIKNNYLSTKIIKEELKWKAKIKLHEGLEKTIAWYLNNKN